MLALEGLILQGLSWGSSAFGFFKPIIFYTISFCPIARVHTGGEGSGIVPNIAFNKMPIFVVGTEILWTNSWFKNPKRWASSASSMPTTIFGLIMLSSKESFVHKNQVMTSWRSNQGTYQVVPQAVSVIWQNVPQLEHTNGHQNSQLNHWWEWSFVRSFFKNYHCNATWYLWEETIIFLESVYAKDINEYLICFFPWAASKQLLPIVSSDIHKLLLGNESAGQPELY